MVWLDATPDVTVHWTLIEARRPAPENTRRALWSRRHVTEVSLRRPARACLGNAVNGECLAPAEPQRVGCPGCLMRVENPWRARGTCYEYWPRLGQ